MVRQIRVPLEIGTIKHGLFLKSVNGQLIKASTELMDFVERHPAHAKGTKAKLTIEITLACEGGEPGMERYSIKAGSKLVVPNQPAAVSDLNVQESQTGGLEFSLAFTENYHEQQDPILPFDPDAGDGEEK